jgi:hypothetical protein
LAGADEERPDVDSHEQVYGLGRLLALSDGVFAFAMTLLVVQLLVPQLGPGQVGQLGTKLLDQMSSYVSYLISFTVISIYWYSHHRCMAGRAQPRSPALHRVDAVSHRDHGPLRRSDRGSRHLRCNSRQQRVVCLVDVVVLHPPPSLHRKP